MGGCRCSYRECPNTTKTENIHFFHYPVKQKERCRIWIENAKKPHFCNLEEDQLRNKVICDQHFEDKWFPNPQKKRLLQGAIPTLPGKYIEDHPHESIEKQNDSLKIAALPAFSSQDQDIQVLPANEDGTVFILDTDAMFTKSQKIESYIYQNGMVVPSPLVSSSFMPSQNLKSYSAPKAKDNKVKKDTNHPEQTKRLYIETDVQMEPGEVGIKAEVPDYSQKSNNSQVKLIEQDESYEIMPKKLATEERVLGSSVKQQKDNSNFDKSYLRKIKQHSREIATIKKMLKEKALLDKPNISTILSALKEQLPPSLFTIVTLNLNQECDLTEDDVEFFTVVHRTSPEVYQLLVDKFDWSLPSVDVVDNIE